MKALKYPLTVRDKDGKEWEVTDYNKYSNGDEFITFYDDNGNVYNEMCIEVHCEWVEAEETSTETVTDIFNKAESSLREYIFKNKEKVIADLERMRQMSNEQPVTDSNQVKDCTTCKFDDDCTDYGMYQCDRCIGDDPPSRWTLRNKP